MASVRSVNPGDYGAVTGSSGSATNNHTAGQITTESLSTASGSTASYVLSNSVVGAGSVVVGSVQNGTNSGGTPQLTTIATAAGTATFGVKNLGSSAFNGTLVISYYVD